MRTWDSPELANQGQLLAAFPTLAADTANAAIRADFAELLQANPDVAALGQLAALGEALPSVKDTLDNGIGQLLARNAEVRVTEAGVREALQRRTGIFNQLTSSDDSVEPFAFLDSDSTENARERFSEALASVMLRPDSRRSLLRNAAVYADGLNRQVREGLSNGSIAYDHIIRGGGLHTANLVATIQECDPEARILVIDDGTDGEELGGQFRKYGDTPVFYMNSRVRPIRDIYDVYGIPKQGGDINSLGLHAPLRLANFVAQSEATNADMGELAALTILLSGADVVFAKDSTEVVSQPLARISIDGLPYPAVTRGYRVESTGAGQPGVSDGLYANEVALTDFWQGYGKRAPGALHGAAQVAGKVVMLVACGDSGKATAKLMVGQGPKDAYKGWSMQQGLPERVYWVAPEFKNLGTKKDFQSGTRPVYSALAPYLPERPGDEAFFTPIAGRFVRANDTGLVELEGMDGRRLSVPGVEVLMRATGLVDPGANSPAVQELRTAPYLTDALGTPFARQGNPNGLSNRTTGIGTAVPLPLRSDAGVPENSVSILSKAPAVTLAGYFLGAQGRRLRQVYGE